jgi:hypothetical protein
MKPSKNRIYCRDSGKQKMLFETEKKANTFIRFNSEEIESESGYSPIRSYHCIVCNGWHVTSRKAPFKVKSKTENILEQYQHDKEQRAIKRARVAEIQKAQAEEMNKHLESIQKQIELVKSTKESRGYEVCFAILKNAFAELEKTKVLLGSKKRISNAEDELIFLKKDLEKISRKNAGTSN